MTRQSNLKSGLDVDVPQTGIAADAYNVACTAAILSGHYHGNMGCEGCETGPRPFMFARHAVTLHRISGQLHRLAERACDEDLACPKCEGSGEVSADPCRACAGTGSKLGRRERRLELQCLEIAEHYGLDCYFQTDPRGCRLYIGEPGTVTSSDYNRGHAIARLGR